MAEQDWHTTFQTELGAARAARQGGNEGRARVCARRAAGQVAAAYFRRAGVIDPGPSAIDRLKLLAALPSLSPAVRETAAHFLVRITPTGDLPVEADLIAEASWLASTLLEPLT
jgi:hypothetical protein